MSDAAVQPESMGVTLYVGGHGQRSGGELVTLDGLRCFSAAQRPFGGRGTALDGQLDLSRIHALLDSGAFTDAPAHRLTPEAALERQLAWETAFAERWDTPWQAEAFASYDLLIDEKWHGARRIKERWSVAEADRAIATTIDAACYLASQRARLAPRRLVLAVQGVDAVQYAECAAEVLKVAHPGDWIGLGGWCILGRWQRRWAPAFWETCWRVLPMIAAAGVRRVHLFGVLWPVALGRLLWVADQYGIAVSTDSARPVLDAGCANGRKAGVHGATWRENVAYWREVCASLRRSLYYQRPPDATQLPAWRQLALPIP